MQTIKALYKLSRPMSTLSGMIAVFLGGYVAQNGHWFNVILASIATMLIGAAANGWNDYLDLEIDRINQPQRPLPSGQVPPNLAWKFAIAASLLSLLVAAFINWTALLMVIFFNGLLYLYSLRLKSTVLMGNATVAFISASTAIFGGIAAGNVRPTLLMALIIGCAIMGREVLKTMADYEGDLSQRCRTVATVWGQRVAQNVFYILVGITLAVMMLPYWYKVYNPIYAYIVALGVYPVVLYIAFRVNGNRSGHQLEKLSQLMKYDFMIWFIAVLLGAFRL